MKTRKIRQQTRAAKTSAHWHLVAVAWSKAKNVKHLLYCIIYFGNIHTLSEVPKGDLHQSLEGAQHSSCHCSVWGPRTSLLQLSVEEHEREKKLKTTCILDKVTKNINLVMILSQHSLENTTDYYCFISFVLKPGLFLDCTSSSVASTPAFLEILRRSCEEVNRGKERNSDCVDHNLCCTEKDLPSVAVGTSLCAGQVWWVSQWAAVCVPVAASGPEEK